MTKEPCGYIDDEGTNINTCEDLPITYCMKCGCFYVALKGGGREEISIKTEKGVVG